MQTYRSTLIVVRTGAAARDFIRFSHAVSSRLRDGAAGLIKELKEQITMPCRPLLPARGDESSEY
jgi:hypothetical protein